MRTDTQTSPEDPLQQKSVREVMVNGRRIKAISQDFNDQLGNLFGKEKLLPGEEGW